VLVLLLVLELLLVLLFVLELELLFVLLFVLELLFVPLPLLVPGLMVPEPNVDGWIYSPSMA